MKNNFINNLIQTKEEIYYKRINYFILSKVADAAAAGQSNMSLPIVYRSEHKKRIFSALDRFLKEQKENFKINFLVVPLVKESCYKISLKISWTLDEKN